MAERCFGSGWRAKLGERGCGLTLRTARWGSRVRLRDIDCREYGSRSARSFPHPAAGGAGLLAVARPSTPHAWVDGLPE